MTPETIKKEIEFYKYRIKITKEFGGLYKDKVIKYYENIIKSLEKNVNHLK